MHSTTPRLWAVPPWRGHHARFKKTITCTKSQWFIIFVHEKTKVSGHASTTQINFCFVFMQQGRRKQVFLLFKRESASRDEVPLGLQLKWRCNTCDVCMYVCMCVCVYVCLFVCLLYVMYCMQHDGLKKDASRDFVPLGLQLKWQCNTCEYIYI